MNLPPSIGTSRSTFAALSAAATATVPEAAAPEAPPPPPVDVGALLMTFAIGAQTAGVRAKASNARMAFARLLQASTGAAAALRALGGDASALEEAIRGAGGPAPP